jgi:transposase
MCASLRVETSIKLGDALGLPWRSPRHRWKNALYRERNPIERFFNRIKHYRRVATRYEKLGTNFLAMIKPAVVRLAQGN